MQWTSCHYEVKWWPPDSWEYMTRTKAVLIRDSKLLLDTSVWVNGVCLVMDWQPVQGLNLTLAPSMLGSLWPPTGLKMNKQINDVSVVSCKYTNINSIKLTLSKPNVYLLAGVWWIDWAIMIDCCFCTAVLWINQQQTTVDIADHWWVAYITNVPKAI